MVTLHIIARVPLRNKSDKHSAIALAREVAKELNDRLKEQGFELCDVKLYSEDDPFSEPLYDA